MAIPPPIDPRLLAAEIEASVGEFNRLCALAANRLIGVIAEVAEQPMPGTPARPVLAVQVIATLFPFCGGGAPARSPQSCSPCSKRPMSTMRAAPPSSGG